MTKEPKLETQLKRVIKTIWQEIGKDKEMCRRLTQNIHFRLEIVMKLKSRQVRKVCYKKEKERYGVMSLYKIKNCIQIKKTSHRN